MIFHAESIDKTCTNTVIIHVLFGTPLGAIDVFIPSLTQPSSLGE